jgi:glycosyltransferase involved in cell wall biosynthesis
MDIIALAPNPWSGPWMNRQQLLSRLASEHAILYSTGPWRIWDRNYPEFRRSRLFGRFDSDSGVVVDEPGILPLRFPSTPTLDAFMCGCAASRWRRRLRRSAGSKLACWVFHPSFEPFIDAVGADYIIYHAYDLYRLIPNWGMDNAEREERFLKRADLIIGSSPVIVADLAERSGRPVELIANGVDFELFAAGPMSEPEDIASIPHPRVGFIGNINLKVDVELLTELARRRRDWQLVVIGAYAQFEAHDAAAFEALRSLDNVHVLGNRSRDAIPAYTHALDVGLLSYRTEGVWTDGIYPLKLHEYLASGLPVISSDFPLAREFPDVVWRARSAEEWEQRIGEALAGRGPGAPDLRRSIARANCWDNRVRQLSALLSALEGGTLRPGAVRALQHDAAGVDGQCPSA